MGFMGTKRSTLIFILISASLLSASFAGGQRKFIDKPAVEVGSSTKESHEKSSSNKQEFGVHPRSLKVTTNDYGSYDPAPTFAKPPFKLINN